MRQKIKVKKMPQDNFFRRCIVAFYYFYSVSRFGKDIKDFEGGNIPPQPPSACSPQVQEKEEHRRLTPQTVYFSLSSTQSFVKVAPIRLLQKMCFGQYIVKIQQTCGRRFAKFRGKCIM